MIELNKLLDYFNMIDKSLDEVWMKINEEFLKLNSKLDQINEKVLKNLSSKLIKEVKE